MRHLGYFPHNMVRRLIAVQDFVGLSRVEALGL
jgi:hypothetical protein